MIDRFKKYANSLPATYWFFAVVLAFLRTGSLYFYNNEEAIASNALFVYILICLLRFAVFILVFLALIFLLRLFFTKFSCQLFDSTAIHNDKWLIYGILSLGWLPHLLIKYPGAVCWDTWRMLHNYLRESFLDADNSAVYSLILGKSVQLFDGIGHANLGLWLVVAGQYLLSVFVFGYSLQLFQRMKIRREIVGLIAIFYLLCPYIIGYFGVAIKDAPYSVLILLLIMLLMEFSAEPSEFCNSKLRLLLLLFSVLGACLLRKNGIYVIGLSLLFFLPAILRKDGDKQTFIPFTVIIVSFLLVFAVKALIGSVYEVVPGSVAGALSVPFQQTARYVKYHGNDVTEEEEEAIDDVLKYRVLAKRYAPRISDPITSKYAGDKEKLSAYFKVWWKQFLRHPFCYIAATWEQNFYLFVPEAEWDNVALYVDDNIGYEEGKTIIVSHRTNYYEQIFYRPHILKAWKEWVVNQYCQLHKQIPVGMMSNISVNTYILFLLFALMFVERKIWQYVFPVMLLSVLCVVVGPVVQGHPRYMFPVIYSTPCFIVYTLFSFQRETIEDSKEVMNGAEHDRHNEEIH